jgi:hypothetical protein
MDEQAGKKDLNDQLIKKSHMQNWEKHNYYITVLMYYYHN